MAELPLWSAQALQNLSSDSRVKVMYFQSSQEVVQEVLHNQSTGSLPYFDPHGDGGTSESSYITGSRTEPLMNPKYHPEAYRSEPLSRQMSERERSIASPSEPRSIPPKQLSIFGDPFESMNKGKEEYKPETKHDWAIHTIENFLSKLSQHSDWLDILKAILTKLTTIKHHGGGLSGQKPKPTHREIFFSKKSTYKYVLIYGTATEYNPSGVWVVEDLHNVIEENYL